jgi:hypothetical protein
MALLVQAHLKLTPLPTTKPMILLHLKSDPPTRVPNPIVVTPPRSIAPSGTTLTPPQFSVAPSEARRQSAITVLPEGNAPPASPLSAGRTNYNDLFSADKKEQFKHFFNDQAVEDRRENAKAASSKSACDTFKKQDDLGEAGSQSNTGVSQNFKPGLVIGAGGSDSDKPIVHACN